MSKKIIESLQNSDNIKILPLTAEDIPAYGEVIRKSFETVARDFGLTKENCPGHTSFISNEALKSKFKEGYYPYGLFIHDEIIGFVSLTYSGDGTYEMNDFSVLPQYRHLGYGEMILDFCKTKVKGLGGSKIIIGILEENRVLKDWYTLKGFST